MSGQSSCQFKWKKKEEKEEESRLFFIMANVVEQEINKLQLLLLPTFLFCAGSILLIKEAVTTYITIRTLQYQVLSYYRARGT